MWSMPRLYNENVFAAEIRTVLVVGGDKKGSLESETVKYGHESYGTWTQR
jgi:hypothetical protein